MQKTYNSQLENLKNDNFLRALFKQETDYTPIWIMRQAGRYLPEYREVRQKAGDFLTLCKNADMACEVTIQPIDRFELDAAIIFSDILTIADALDLGLTFNPGEGPKIAKPIENIEQVKNLPKIDVKSDLNYVFNAIRTTKSALENRVPLIGFTGSPWTLATYLIEGGSSKLFHKIKKIMYKEPETLHLLLDKLADIMIDYLNYQIDAGANVVQIFDSWGGVLAHREYEEFSLKYMNKIIAKLKPSLSGNPIGIILFTKGGGLWLEKMAESGATALGLDWSSDINSAYKRVGDKVALQGNLDPSILFSNPDVIKHKAEQILADFPALTGHIFNLGHGINKNTPIENVAALVKSVREYKAKT